MNNEISNEPLSKHDRQERRRQEKEAERRARKKARWARAFRNYAMAVLVMAPPASGIYLLAKSAAPKEEDFSRAIPVMEASHIAAGSRLPEYTSNPPTSGPHYSQTAKSGFREEAIPDQNIIHNLEHGDIWIAYHPRVTDEIKEELKEFAAAKVVITPRETNETDITLAAWGRLDTFNVENNALPVLRIKDFIKRYTNKGPERVPGASGGI